MVHLSDLETSDSTRISIDRKAIQDQIQAATPRHREQQSTTVIPNRQAYLAEAEKIRAELRLNPATSMATGARPKQPTGTRAAPPQLPFTMEASDNSHKAEPSRSSQANTSSDQRHHHAPVQSEKNALELHRKAHPPAQMMTKQ